MLFQAFALFALLHGVVAQPDPAHRFEDAAEAFAQGSEAYAREDFVAAAEAFARAQALSPHPNTEFNLGLALAKLGRDIDAWAIFDRLARSARSDDDRREAGLQADRLRARLAFLDVRPGPGTRVCVAGQEHVPGRARALQPGVYRVQTPDFDQRVELIAGETRILELRVASPRAPALSRSAERPLLITTVAGAALAAGSGLAVAAGPSRRAWNIGWGLTAFVSGTVSAGTGLAVLRRRRAAPASTHAPPVASRPAFECGPAASKSERDVGEADVSTHDAAPG